MAWRKRRESAQIALGGLRESGSVFARKENHVPGEVESDLVQRKVREFNPLREADVRVPIIACKQSCSVFLDLQVPDLKLFEFDCPDGLSESNLIEEPIGSAFLRDVFNAISEGDVPNDSVAVPCFRAGELLKVFFFECFL